MFNWQPTSRNLIYISLKCLLLEKTCNKIIADPVYSTFDVIYSKVDLHGGLGQACSLGGPCPWSSLEITCPWKPAHSNSDCFALQGGAITILTAAERPGHFSGMVLISPLVLANPESATTFKVNGLRVL